MAEKSSFARELTAQQEETLFSVLCLIGVIKESLYHVGMQENSESAAEAAQALEVCHKMLFDVMP